MTIRPFSLTGEPIVKLPAGIKTNLAPSVGLVKVSLFSDPLGAPRASLTMNKTNRRRQRIILADFPFMADTLAWTLFSMD